MSLEESLLTELDDLPGIQRSHHHSKEEVSNFYRYESLDFDVVDNRLVDLWRKSQSFSDQRIAFLAEWFIYFVLGMIMGMIAFTITFIADYFHEFKFDHTKELLYDGRFVHAYFRYLGISCFYCICASLPVIFYEDLAMSSGIPEIKCYLNGTNVPRLLRLRTVLAKLFGLTFSIASGLPCDAEGPMVHTGSAIAAWLSHFAGMPECSRREYFKYFRNDNCKRDYVSAGAASGVAAAFGAPVGSVLFSFEEASSFWSLKLTWRVFFTSMVSSFAFNILKSLELGATGLNHPGLITFGQFSTEGYYIWEIGFFILMALGGGILGAFYIKINHWLTILRQRFITPRRVARFLEVVFVGSFCASIQFWLPSFFYTCTVIPTDSVDAVEYYVRYTCPEGTYNGMATLIFSPFEEAIKGLFHITSALEWSVSLHSASQRLMSPHAGRAVLLPLRFCRGLSGQYPSLPRVAPQARMPSLTGPHGLSVPGGIFAPCIIMGAAYGRFLGAYIGLLGESTSHGTYALIGATCFLGGITRMTVSLAVILLETTNDVQYLLPIMLVIMVSKWVGDAFNISVYDQYIELKCIPFVEASPPKAIRHLKANDVMISPVITLHDVESVATVYQTLTQTTHNGFPVVNGDGNYQGIILRSQLIVLLQRKCFLPPSSSAVRSAPFLPSSLHYYDFACSLSSTPFPIEKVNLSSTEKSGSSLRMDLRLVMNKSSYTVQGHWPLPRVYHLYRTMGLRHLPVLSIDGQVIGILTRKELNTDFKSDLS